MIGIDFADGIVKPSTVMKKSWSYIWQWFVIWKSS